MTDTILPTENTTWGFWGTMGEHADVAWPVAFASIQHATDADVVHDLMHGGSGLVDAVAATTAQWMAWQIGRRASRETGIPTGLPYLTGLVIQEGIAAEAAVG